MYEIDMRIEHNDGVWLVAEFDVPVTPARAFEEVATAEGMSAWFAPTSLEPQVGGSLLQFDDALCSPDDAATCGEVTVYDAPQSAESEGTFAWVEDEWMGPGTPVPHWHTSFEISCVRGGANGAEPGVLLYLRSGFHESNELTETSVAESLNGWRHNLLSLLHRLSVFPDGRVRTLQLFSDPRPGTAASAWSTLLSAVGMTSTTQAGEPFSARGVQGTVIDLIDGSAVLALSTPTTGTLVLSAHPTGETVEEASRNSAFSVRFTEFVASSSDAQMWEAADWNEWLELLLG